MNGSATLGKITLAGGVATWSGSKLAAGTRSITAVYNGSARFSGSTSSVLSQVVDPATTTVSLSSTQDPSTFGQSVTFTATVLADSIDTPLGSVTFRNGTAPLGQVNLTNGVATWTTTTLAASTRSITAVYNGGTDFSASTSPVFSQVVNPATTTVSLSSSQNPSTFGQSVAFTATVLSEFTGIPVNAVTFKNGSATLGKVTLVSGAATLTTTTLSTGTKSITAVYDGSTDFAGSTSPVLSQIVQQAASTVTLSSSQNPSAVGQSVAFTATVAPQFAGNPLGSVTFKNGNSTLGQVTLAGGAATLTAASLTAGSHTITSKYSGSADFSASSATLKQTVSATASSSYTLTASALSPASVASGNSSTSTITVTPISGYTGSVQLSCGAITGGAPAPGCSFSPSTVTINGTTGGASTLTVSTSTTSAGNYTISVTASDTNGLGPSNGIQTLTLITVPAGPPSYTLTATAFSPGSVTSGGSSTSTVTVTPENGYSGNVNLSCSIVNPGTPAPSCSFSASGVTISGTAAGTSVLTVSTSSTVPAGSYMISVAASDTNKLAPGNGAQTLTLIATSVIQHIVVIFQENRTPDNLFHDSVLISRGADIASSGINSLGETIPLSAIDLGTVGSNPQDYDLGHSHAAFVTMYDGGKLDGADQIPCVPSADCPPNAQFMYVNPSDVQPYFAMAEQYTFGDRMFQTNQGPSFPAHQFILAGTSAPTATSSFFAAEGPTLIPAGCIAPLTSTVAIIDATGSETNQPPQYPCFEHPTLTDLLDTKGVTWRYYTLGAGSIWTAPDAIEHICQQQTVIPQTRVLTDIGNGQLPQVSWVIPDGRSSDHALVNDGSGPSWVASIVNAIGNSSYWANTVIIITWDDWGGWYDHVPPKVIDDGVSWGSGYVYGFRVPLVVVSPYAKAAYISHIPHDFGSILKFVETTFNLPSLGYADAPADDLSDCFDFTQTPLTFQQIPAPLDAAHFINDKRPPTDPDDD
jgi:hypothetical protein